MVQILIDLIKTGKKSDRKIVKNVRTFVSETEESEIDNLSRDDALKHLKEIAKEN